jgi:hypothetical protein
MQVEDEDEKKRIHELEETWPLEQTPQPPEQEDRDTSRDPDNTTEDEKPDRVIRIIR